MKYTLPKSALLALILCLPTTTGCATVLGTVVSPITGGVDLALKYGREDTWYLTPVYFLGGVVAGPFKAFYNGVNYDASIFAGFNTYWKHFDSMFRPFRLEP